MTMKMTTTWIVLVYAAIEASPPRFEITNTKIEMFYYLGSNMQMC